MSGSDERQRKDNTRAEEFKRATAGVLRAMAESTEVQVAFQPGPSGLAGKRARLPLPTRALPAAEMARLRGASDAWRCACATMTTRCTPRGCRRGARRGVYDALEQARVEVMGAPPHGRRGRKSACAS